MGGCQFLKFLIFFFLPKFQSFTKNYPESSIFIAFTSSLFQNVCNFYRYATIYIFLKKYRVKRGEGGKTEEKNPTFGKKKQKNFFLVIIFIPKLFLLLFLIKTSFSEDFGSKNI